MARARRGWLAQSTAENTSVEEKPVPTYCKPPGRKAGELTVSLDIHGLNRRARFPLRFDLEKGDFIAIHGDRMFVSKTRKALEDHMRKVAEETVNLAWKRYIAIEYVARVPPDPDAHWTSDENLEPNDDRKKRDVYGISLEWTVVELSDPFTTVGSDKPIRIQRKVHDDGDVGHESQTCVELPAGLVPFSPERLETLRAIRRALTELDRRMASLFAGSPETVAKQLGAIAASGQITALMESGKRSAMLALPPAPPSGKRHR
jgi:hypothetical protein